jgi:hypothetical protein
MEFLGAISPKNPAFLGDIESAVERSGGGHRPPPGELI